MSHEEIIREQIASSLDEMRTSLDRLRRGLQDLVAMVPEAPDPEALATKVAEAIPPPPPPPAPPPPPPPPPARVVVTTNNALLYHVAALEHANSQATILRQLMEAASEFASRGVLFIVRGTQAQAWNGFGFPEAELKRWKADVDQDPLLRTMVSGRSRMLLDNTLPAFIQVSGTTRRSMLSPLLLKGKVAAFLFADSGEEGKLDHYSMDLLLKVASLVIDILPLYAKREPLAASLENQDIICPAPEAAPVAEEAPLFEDSGTLSTHQELEEAQASRTIMGQIPTMEPEVEAAPPPPPEPEAPAEEEPEAVEAVEVVEPAEAEQEEITAVGAPAEPPPPSPPAEEPIPPGEEKMHEDAKRFSRLLIQEIMLYHPREVEQGKRNRNLYHLLKEDIDRSREAFEQRFQKPSVRSRDYFHKALIKHLADGDEALLGT